MYQYSMRAATVIDRLALQVPVCEDDESLTLTLDRDELRAAGAVPVRLRVRSRDGVEREMVVTLEPVARA